MNIQVRGTVQIATKGATGTTIPVAVDAAAHVGDLLVIPVNQTTSGQTIGTPSGWSSAINGGQGGGSTNTKSWLFYKLAASGDIGATVTLTSNSTAAASAFCAAIYDADGGAFTGALDGTPGFTHTGVDSTTLLVDQTPTTSGANSLVIYTLGIGKTGGGTFTVPSGTPTITELGDVSSGPGASTLAMMVQAASGAVASRTWTVSGTFDTIVALTAAFAYTPPSGSSVIPVLYSQHLIGG